MKKRIRFLSLILFFIGFILLFNSNLKITGNIIGFKNGLYHFNSIFGFLFILISIILFIKEGNLEKILGESSDYNNWIEYSITPDSELIDIEKRYIVPKDIKKRVKLIHKEWDEDKINNYISNLKVDYEKMSPENISEDKLKEFESILGQEYIFNKQSKLQKDIESNLTNGKGFFRYVSEDKDIGIGETINRRNSYEEQFYEPHAAGGGRVIDVKSHINHEGKLEHFNKPANGQYIWIIDKEGNFIIGNRGGINEKGYFTGIIHDMYQMPPDFGSGERHKKIDKRKLILPHSTLAKGLNVYGAGEVTIKRGLIKDYNADSGHYAKLTTDIGGPYEPDNFVKQSIEAFTLFSKKYGWKEIKGGAKYNSHY